MTQMDTLIWIQNWYQSQCNGDWEHQYGVSINTIDNPGWNITIDIQDTVLENIEMKYQFFENSNEDWYGIKIEEGKFNAFGDPTKLEFLLLKFKEFIVNNT